MFPLATVDRRSQHCRTPRNMHGTFVHTVRIHPDSTPARPPARTRILAHVHAHILAHLHARTRTHTRSRARTRLYVDANVRTRACTHTHTLPPICRCKRLLSFLCANTFSSKEVLFSKQPPLQHRHPHCPHSQHGEVGSGKYTVCCSWTTVDAVRLRCICCRRIRTARNNACG